MKFKDKDKLSLGEIHIQYYSDGDTQAYIKRVYHCEASEQPWKEPGFSGMPEIANKRWLLKQVPRSGGSGLTVKCNDELISSYLLPDDFQDVNPSLCQTFLNGDVRFITFISKPQSAEEYFRDIGK